MVIVEGALEGGRVERSDRVSALTIKGLGNIARPLPQVFPLALSRLWHSISQLSVSNRFTPSITIRLGLCNWLYKRLGDALDYFGR